MRTSTFTARIAPCLAGILVLSAFVNLNAQRRGRGDNEALGVPVSTNAIVDDPGSYLGKQVTISAGVEEVLSKTAFLVDQRKAAGATAVSTVGKPVLVIAPYLTKTLEQKKYLMVSGQLVKLEASALARVAADYTLDLTPELRAKYEGQPVLVATSVVDSAFAELGRKPSLPPTPRELAMSTTMKSIASTMAAMRTAAQASNGAVVTESAAALQPLFTQVETTWDDLGQVPAAQWARDARGHAVAIQGGVAAGDWNAVTTSVAALNQVCGTCHAAYRDRLDDGTFRFKAGSF